MRRYIASGILSSGVVISFALATTISLAAPLNTGATRLALGSGIAGEWIKGGFASLSMVNADPADAAITTMTKGNLPRLPVCAGVVWPNVDASCLSTAGGFTVPRVRSIATGYPNGINATILIRTPAALVAPR